MSEADANALIGSSGGSGASSFTMSTESDEATHSGGSANLHAKAQGGSPWDFLAGEEIDLSGLLPLEEHSAAFEHLGHFVAEPYQSGLSTIALAMPTFPDLAAEMAALQ